MVLLMPTLLTKQCPTTLEPPLISNLMPTSSQQTRYVTFRSRHYHFHLLTVHVSGGSPQSFHYSNLGNLLMKSFLSVPSVSCNVSSNVWNVILLTVSTISLKPTTCSADSKPVFVKDGAVKLRLLEKSKQLKMASNNA